MNADRRKHKRYPLICKVIYSTAENPKRRRGARTFNISLGGIGLKIKSFINESDPLKLLIFPPHKGKAVEAKGRLVWQNRFGNINENRAGIQFTDVGWTRIKELLP